MYKYWLNVLALYLFYAVLYIIGLVFLPIVLLFKINDNKIMWYFDLVYGDVDFSQRKDTFAKMYLNKLKHFLLTNTLTKIVKITSTPHITSAQIIKNKTKTTMKGHAKGITDELFPTYLYSKTFFNYITFTFQVGYKLQIIDIIPYNNNIPLVFVLKFTKAK